MAPNYLHLQLCTLVIGPILVDVALKNRLWNRQDDTGRLGRNGNSAGDSCRKLRCRSALSSAFQLWSSLHQLHVEPSYRVCWCWKVPWLSSDEVDCRVGYLRALICVLIINFISRIDVFILEETSKQFRGSIACKLRGAVDSLSW